MSETFDSFIAPQYCNFIDSFNDENMDAYFEIDHENVQQNDPLEDPLEIRYSDEVQQTDAIKCNSPFKDITENHCNNEENCDFKPRRSMSVGDIAFLYNPENGEETSKVNQKCREETAAKCKPSNTLKKNVSNMSLNKGKPSGSIRSSTPRLTRIASKENLSRLAQPKRYGSAQNLNQNSYVSMAEAVRKFQDSTPTRFRSKPKPNSVGGFFNKLGVTVPQSPALMTKNRQRPVQAISREAQEALEFEEAQKFRIKAHPLNKKILQGPLKPMIPLEKKPVTAVEPFNITSQKKTIKPPVDNQIEFHARPVPRETYTAPKLKTVHRTSVTMPQAPNLMKQSTREPVKPQEQPKPPVKLTKTVPKPFSFESRDQEIYKKREQLLKKTLEEEKKAREFHARPVPKGVSSTGKNSLHCSSTFHKSENGLTQSEENLVQSTQFKARPPTVLYKKPFEPKKERQHLIEITEFQFNTEIRAKEREEFEQMKKEKEEQIALAKQLEEQERLQREEEEVARLRKEAEHKAQPIKKYKGVKIQPCGKVTEPITPKFHTDMLRNKENKENTN